MAAPSSTAELRALAETSVVEPLPQEQVEATLAQSPFIYVPGTFNVRDLGLVPSASNPDDAPPIKPGLVFRSGTLQHLTPEGKAVLKDKLGIKAIFDVRSKKEHASTPDPEIVGVKGVWKVTAEEDATVPNLHLFAEGLGERGFTEMYIEVLDLYREAYKAVLEWVRDHPGEPFLFHCTAGRDRTGVLAGLLLSIAGAPHDVVVLDFLLSRVGTEPAREELMQFALKGAGAYSFDDPGFQNMAELREKCWDAFVAEADKKYGGFWEYAVKELGLGEDGVKKVRENLKSGGVVIAKGGA